VNLVLRVVALVLVLAATAHPVWAAPGFDTKLTARVFAAALQFTAPRTLDPVTPGQLALWGLHGITALDPAFTTMSHGRLVWLANGDRPIYTAVAPGPEDAPAWGRVAADINGAAYEASAELRRAGTEALTQSFFDEMFNHLDPYSRYVPPEPAEAERDKLSLDASAGIALVRQHGATVISDVVPNGPGAEAGARVGDRLLSVDGQNVRNTGLARVNDLLTGASGTNLTLRVRGLDGAARTLPITLDFVPPETVFSSRAGALLVLRISAFDGNTAERLSQALEAGMASKPAPAAVVLDLRGNRGGLLRQAVTGVALLAEHGIIASTAGRDPQATHDWRIDDGGDLTNGTKVIILVDARTASAAEIMAAALADLGRAVVVGSSTLGKGLVQTIISLPDGGELFVTWSRVLAPKSWPIQTLGVMPQICTSRGHDETMHELTDLAQGHWDTAAVVAKTRAARAPLPVAEAMELRQACPAAEGGDDDMMAAQFLATHQAAYDAALLK
jgi:carboxyl-terminal processing protease